MTHELSLISNLLNKILEIAIKQDAKKVTAVKVRLGALSHISPGHFRDHFETGTPGTIAEGARLDIETSKDLQDPHAQEILLLSVDVEED